MSLRPTPRQVVEWERRLAPFGLSLQGLRTQWLQDITDFSDGAPHFQEFAFDRELDGVWWLRNETHVGSGLDWTRMQLVQTRSHRREVPELATDDLKLREFFIRRYPHIGNGQRKFARRAAALWYLAFRAGLSNAEIGEILGMTTNSVQSRLTQEKMLAEGKTPAAYL